jgi:8-oxo-dGTP diphosphatase
MTGQQVRVGTGVFVRCQDGYVLLKRLGSHGEGEWSLPGGHLEFGESVADCARREVLEELGVSLKGNVAPIPFFSEDQFPDHGKHYITLYLLAETDEKPRIMEPHKASEMIIVRDPSLVPGPLFCGTEGAWRILGSM